MGETKNKQQQAKAELDQKFALSRPSRQILEDLAVNIKQFPPNHHHHQNFLVLSLRTYSLFYLYFYLNYLRLPVQKILILIIPFNMHFVYPNLPNGQNCVMPLQSWMDLSRKVTNIKLIVCMVLLVHCT